MIAALPLTLVLAGAVTLASGPQAVEPQAEADTPGVLDVVRGTHRVLELDNPLERFAVGDPELLSVEPLPGDQLLLVGLATGRTSLGLWVEEAPFRSLEVRVQRDLSLLSAALLEVDASIRVEAAYDRDAVLLRGVVDDLATAARAEGLARAWIDAEAPALTPAPSPGQAAAGEEPAGRAGAVLNLLRVRGAATPLEERLEQTFADFGLADLALRRIPAGSRPDDARDLFVLEGAVREQADLTRALLMAAAVIEPDAGDADIKVLVDEAGGLVGARTQSGSGSSGGQGANLFSANQGGAFGGGGGRGAQGLFNRLEANPGRARALSAANGRLLAFVDVERLPQVRVEVELFEVDVSALQELDGGFQTILSDFAQGPLAGLDSALDSSPLVGSVSPADVQGVLNAIDGGGSLGVQLGGENAAVQATLGALEARGYARSLSRPSLTVLSGEIAQFQVGGQIPIQTSFATEVGGAGTAGILQGVTFEAFGVLLSVRPLVDGEGRITLDLLPEIVQPDAELTATVRQATGGDLATIGFESRSLRTTARLDDGSSLLVGGLLSRIESDSVSGLPLLSELPLIGALFRNTNQQSREQELILVVTPTQVREADPRAAIWPHLEPLELLRRNAGVRPEPDPLQKTDEPGTSPVSAALPARTHSRSHPSALLP